MIDDTALWAELRTTLAQLELVSSAPTCNYNPDGPGSDESTTDTPTVNPPHLRYKHRLHGVDQGLRRRLDAAEATGDHHQRETEQAKAHDWAHQARRQIHKDAQAELAHITGRTDQPPAKHTAVLDTVDGIDQAVREDAPGKPADDVAAALGLSVFMVRRIYVDEGLDPHDGTVIDPNAPAVERQRRARELADRGLSERQIRDLLGWKSTTQVRRALGRAA
jgi:hypothetical protein